MSAFYLAMFVLPAAIILAALLASGLLRRPRGRR
jgi:hypothetical protein